MAMDPGEGVSSVAKVPCPGAAVTWAADVPSGTLAKQWPQQNHPRGRCQCFWPPGPPWLHAELWSSVLSFVKGKERLHPK